MVYANRKVFRFSSLLKEVAIMLLRDVTRVLFCRSLETGNTKGCDRGGQHDKGVAEPEEEGPPDASHFHRGDEGSDLSVSVSISTHHAVVDIAVLNMPLSTLHIEETADPPHQATDFSRQTSSSI